MMNCKRFLGMLLLLIAFASLSGTGWAIPANLTISGRLLDDKGQPIHYYDNNPLYKTEIRVDLAAELKFYDSETTQTVLKTITTTASTYQGYFTIHFTLPGSMLVKDSLFYSLAIDADQNGLTSADLFAGRFEIGSVPFALSAQPAQSYTIHGGIVGFGSSLWQDFGLHVVPFETPPGGIEFNKMYHCCPVNIFR